MKVPATRARPAVPDGPYVVLGLARAGQAAVKALVERAGPDQVRASDFTRNPKVRRARELMRSQGVSVHLGGGGMAALGKERLPACVVKSPGVRFDSPPMVRAAELGLPVIDELELGWRLGSSPVVGITGTNGKSTTAALCTAVLEAAGQAPVLAGNTQFGPPLSEVARHDGFTVCEVSSFQLESCPSFVPEVAVFTNLTRDHLHRHVTMRRYGECKRRMFVRGSRAVELAVVNVDQPFGRLLADDIRARGGRVVTFGDHPESDFRVIACEWTKRSGKVDVRTPSRGTVTLRTKLPGPHNARNAAAALAFGSLLEIEPEAIEAGAAACAPVPGRFELVEEGQPIDLVVDFAHTPDALDNLMRTLRPLVDANPDARLHVVLAAAGTHDPGKRADMGRIVAESADRLIVTTTNLFGEGAESVCRGLIQGAEHAGVLPELVPDRREAIRHALLTAAPGDMVVLTTRGVLPRLIMQIGEEGVPFVDSDVCRELLAELGMQSAAGRGAPDRVLAAGAG